MKKSLLKSRTILQLEESIKCHGDSAVEEFLCYLKENGTPIIEELENDTENDLVTFIYKGDKRCKSVLFVPDIGVDRYKDNYKDFRMERIMGTDLWYITYEIENNIRLMYYFSPNDPLDNNWYDRYINRVVYDKFCKNILIEYDDGKEVKCSYIVMPEAPKHVWAKKIDGIPEGNIDEYKFKSKNIEDKRRIRVYTPYEYDKKGKPYGFIVLTDGQDYIDTLMAVETLNNLIASKKIPPIIGVFIDSIEQTRETELNCSDVFRGLIADEIIPWIKNNYDISGNPREAIIGGLSSGGLAASYIALSHSEIFGNVLSQSGWYCYKPEGFITINEDCFMSTKFKERDKLPIKFYLDVGILENRETMIGTNINLRDTLISKGYHVDFQWFNSSHDYLSWGETLAHGLISLIGIK
ncbi:DUF3327 domain-containing protein [Acidilutibacter cellobiosedens]|jgi:enterochelin esterase family protein|uniref:DUF3327 domain-containing protein n=1 Tax=Acidilutibacter cellobiosedens TaxID=2507161 RepID=A0A410QBV8_9FIRM|nr:alpha/beta hydrolase-fold protein [Acidilutibacter cellobiosedens]MBE6083587.1 DUF3327 domain-containing protein [Tissierellaceae bacterium]QAT61461.1 DUF3327 domain-containing protein [Acidilutibacter cellobiosedens]